MERTVTCARGSTSRSGGSGASFGFSAVICEELGRTGRDGIQTAVSVHSDIVVPYIDELARPELRRRWLPGCASGEIVTAIGMTEPEVGSDLAALRTTAVRVGDEYVLNGQKTFISNGISCDLFVVAARTDPAEPGYKGISLIVVENGAPGFHKTRKLEKMGQHVGDTGRAVPGRLPRPGDEPARRRGQGLRVPDAQPPARAADDRDFCTDRAEQILEKTLAYIKERKAFGQPIGTFQHNAFKVAERATENRDRPYVRRRAHRRVHRRRGTSRAAVSMAKWWLSDLANKVAYDAVQLHGGYGYMSEYPVSRDYVDVRALPIYAGSNEVMKRIIARMLGLGEP
jgi:acyl-CoA dehydrogenase